MELPLKCEGCIHGSMRGSQTLNFKIEIFNFVLQWK